MWDIRKEKHLGKFDEARERGDIGSMNYMAREMRGYMERMDILKDRMLPKSRRGKKQ